MKSAAVTDFSQYAGLRAKAQQNDPEALRAAAKQFEGLMLQQMLKSMRAASIGDDVLGGEQVQFFQEMFDQQLAKDLSNGRGLGLADMMVRQLQATQGGASHRADIGMDGFSVVPQDRQGFDIRARAAVVDAYAAGARGVAGVPGSRPQVPSGYAPRSAVAAAQPQASSPEAFVHSVLPHAEKAAAELGIPASVLVAQAALETGWGKHAMRRADGSHTFNLFGIKADKGWKGERVQTMTHEFENGEMQSQQAQFRAYPSLSAAFDDYVRFLKDNPRYARALAHGGDARQFTGGLQQAGYATDPAYAEKIMRIANGTVINTALEQSQARPLLKPFMQEV